MATANAPTPGPMAETDHNDVGVFVSNVPIGFVLASPADAARIQQQLKLGSVKEMTRQFVDDLIAIKLLAPTESAALLIQPVPLIREFVSSLRRELVMNYYLQQGDR